MASGTVHLRLSKILKARGLQQKVLATQSGLSKTAVSDLSGEGIRAIRLDTIARLCDTLKIEPGELFEYVPGSEDLETQ